MLSFVTKPTKQLLEIKDHGSQVEKQGNGQVAEEVLGKEVQTNLSALFANLLPM